MTDKDYYINLRNKYTPTDIKVIFIFESPPDPCGGDRKFFFKPDGDKSEPLFSAMMEGLFCINPKGLKDKEEGLKKFQNAGYFLIDATYTPVNRMSIPDKKAQIIKDFPELVKDLKKYTAPNTKIILVMVWLYNFITKDRKEDLRKSGIKIANLGDPIPFPRFPQQKEKFIEKIRSYTR